MVCVRASGKNILYLALARGVIALSLLSFPALSMAQEELPEIPPQQKKPPQKNDKGPRAVGLVRLSSNGKATRVPIAIRIDGRFYHAPSYKPNPWPMPLEPGRMPHCKPPTTHTSNARRHPPHSDRTNSGAGDTNRPRLSRGKPTQPLPSDEDVPGYSKLGSPPTTAKSPTATPATPAVSGGAKEPIKMY